MKTAEEILNEFGIDKIDSARGLSFDIDEFVHAIQLDAMKEGMRRARKIILNTNPNPVHKNSLSPQSARDEELRALIFTAAEQLTEKDLL